MRILHVVTLIDPDGSFGGPVRVALNLARELTRRGQHVSLAAGTRGFGSPVRSHEGVEALTAPVYPALPGAGFSGLASPRLLASLASRLRQVDVLHVHLSRDLVTMPAAAMALVMGVPLVVQPHGMIDPSDRALARPMDLLLTRRVLRRAAAVLHLTDVERGQLEQVARAPLRFTRLPNGVPSGARTAGRARDDGTILFAGRLHARKQPSVFVRAAAEVLRTRPSARFVMAGPDEGELADVRRLIDALGLTAAVSYVGPLTHADLLDRLRSAALYVLPSVDEPYPMTVLEAMSVGTPVVVSTSCGLAEDIRRTGAGLVVDPSVPAVAGAIGAMLGDEDRRLLAGRIAAETAEATFGLEEVTDRLMAVYERAAAG